MEKLSALPARSNRTPKVGAVLLFSLAVLLLILIAPSSSMADEQGVTGDVGKSFSSAASRWGVPVEVLMAIGYVESRWEQRDGEPSLDQGFGIMHLTDRPDGTLQRAVEVTGLDAGSIRMFAQPNIEAGAAILGDISHKPTAQQKINRLEDWYGAVAAYSGASDPYVADQYAQEVFRLVRDGAEAQLASGEHVVLPPSSVRVPEAATAAPDSEDYPPALWVAAHPNNYRVGRPYPPLDTIVIHDTEGSYNSAISWFQNPNSGVSAHYVIRSSDGQVTQMVRNADTGYHAGVWDYNVRSVGIEHEGYMSQPGWYTEAMYQSSSALVRNLTERYGIRKDRAHVIAHSEIPGQSHTDPGPYWNWTYYMSLVRRDSQRAALVDNTDPGFAPVPAQVDPQHYWWTYSGGYNSSNAFMTTSVSNPANSYNSATWSAYLQSSGYYDVYTYVPYVNNGTPDTMAAKYKVHSADGVQQVSASQKALSDLGVGNWAHVGKFRFNGGANALVKLDDYTGETGKCVWFDAVMWIPALGSAPPPTPIATITTRPNTPTSVPPTQPMPTQPPTTQPPPPTSPPTAPPTAGPTWTPGACGMRFTDLPDTYWAYEYISYLYCRGVVGGYPDGTFRPGEGSTRGQFAKMLVLSQDWILYNPVNPTFSDVPPSSTFYTYVETAALRQVIGGYPDGTFKVNNPVTRGQAAKMLVLARSWSLYTPTNPSFSDVPQSHWAYGYVETALIHSIVSGSPDGLFRPDTLVNRGQLAKMVALTAQAPRGVPGSESPTVPSAPTMHVAAPPKETAAP